MIIVKGTEGDQICLVVNEDAIVNLAFTDSCNVVGCRGDHLYGYNFCEKHKHLLPISSDKTRKGFQVSFIEYWKSKGKHILQTHTYVDQKLSKAFSLQQKVRKLKKLLESKLFVTYSIMEERMKHETYT